MLPAVHHAVSMVPLVVRWFFVYVCYSFNRFLNRSELASHGRTFRIVKCPEPVGYGYLWGKRLYKPDAVGKG